MNMFNDFFKGKTVLITGATGFKGSWLSIWLKELGANVIGYSLDPYTKTDNFEMTNLKNSIVDIRNDIRNIEKLQDTFDKYKPEIIFHLAAQALVKRSYEVPIETYQTNVMGTMNVLECIRNNKASRVGIMVTSDKCYQNKEKITGYVETDSMGGDDIYSSSKGCAELLIHSYQKSFFEKNKIISSVRSGNVFGGGDWSKYRLIPDCMTCLAKNEPIKIKNPDYIRPWQFVLEPLYGYIKLAYMMYENKNEYSSPWNFGPPDTALISVEDITKLAIKKWGNGNYIIENEKNALKENKILTIDSTKAQKYLNWRNILSLEEAMELTIEWYKNYNNSNVYDLCKNQIERYVEKI